MDSLDVKEPEPGFLNFNQKTWRDDITFVVEDKRFYASKCVLAMYSPVFEKMFGSSFKEKEQTVIELPEKNAEDFSEFLQCLYPTSNVTVTETNVRQVLPLADEYQVARLVDDCREVFTNNISSTLNKLTPRDLIEYYASVTRYGLKKHEHLYVNEIVRQGNFQMISPEAEHHLTKDELVEFQKSYINKQQDVVEDLTTKFVKLCMKTRGNTTAYLNSFKNVRGAEIEFSVDDVFDATLLDKVYSKSVELWNVSFCLSVSVCNRNERNKNDKYLSIFLECRFPDDDDGWSCTVEGDIILENTCLESNRLMSSKSLSQSKFTTECQTQGFKTFETLSNFLTATEKAVEKYSCKITAYILVETPNVNKQIDSV